MYFTIHLQYYPIMCSIKRKGMCLIPSPELRVHVDIAMGLVKFFLICPTGKCSFLENLNYRRTEINAAHQHFFLGLVKMTLGLYMVPTVYQTVKLTSLCILFMRD